MNARLINLIGMPRKWAWCSWRHGRCSPVADHWHCPECLPCGWLVVTWTRTWRDAVLALTGVKHPDWMAMRYREFHPTKVCPACGAPLMVGNPWTGEWHCSNLGKETKERWIAHYEASRHFDPKAVRIAQERRHRPHPQSNEG